MTGTNEYRRPTGDHPAKWLTAAELQVGDLVVLRSSTPDERAAGVAGGPTAPITALTWERGRWFVQVAGQNRYPKGLRKTHRVLVLR